MVIEVIAAGEGDVPTVAQAEVTTEVQVLRKDIGIAHRLVVEVLVTLAHRDTIADADGPRQRECHIAVFIGGSLRLLLLGTMLGFLHILVDIGFQTHVVIIVIVFSTTTLIVVLVLVNLFRHAVASKRST